jgi:Protein kinase domain
MSVDTAAPSLDGLTFVRLLGSGGYARVYLYTDVGSHVEVAVKVMDVERLTEGIRDRFMDEATTMAKLSHHPFIAQVHRAGVTADGRPYIVMKYYPGDTYAVRVKRAPFSASEALRAGVRVACAVETAHRAGIFHRDIKPANILTDQYDIPALTDFGIAAASDQTQPDAEGMSLPWASPETVFSTRRPDAASDIYSLGATIWHLLAGRSPFEQPGGDNSTLALMRRIESTPPPSTGRGEVPASLERLLAACLAKSSEARPASALELARGLQAVEQEQQLPLTPLTLLDVAEPRHATAPVAGDETRIRAPQTVVAQPPAREPRSARERERVLPPEPALGETQRRVAAVPVSVPAPVMEETRRGRALLVGALVAVVVVIAVAFALLSSGGKSAGAKPPEQVVPQSVGLVASPGTPIVHVSQAGDTIVFRWSGYPNAVDGDTFRWRRSGSVGAAQGTSRTAVIRVKAKRTATVCLAVQVIRNDGSSPSSFSDPACSS